MIKFLIIVIALIIVAGIFYSLNPRASKNLLKQAISPVIKEIQKYKEDKKDKLDAEFKISNLKEWHKKQLRKTHLKAVNYLIYSLSVFKGKYNGLAGDFTKADLFGVGKNGDGNAKIKGRESINFWEHLLNAKMILDYRTEIDSADSNAAIIGINVPASEEFKGVGYWAGYYSAYGHSANAIIIGSESPNGKLEGAAFTPEEAKYLNKHVSNGGVYTVNAYGRDDCIIDGKYNVKNNEKSCILVYWFDKSHFLSNAPKYYTK